MPDLPLSKHSVVVLKSDVCHQQVIHTDLLTRSRILGTSSSVRVDTLDRQRCTGRGKAKHSCHLAIAPLFSKPRSDCTVFTLSDNSTAAGQWPFTFYKDVLTRLIALVEKEKIKETFELSPLPATLQLIKIWEGLHFRYSLANTDW